MWCRTGREMVAIVFISVSFRARVLAAPEVGRAEAVGTVRDLEVGICEVVVADQRESVGPDRYRRVAADAAGGVNRKQTRVRADDVVAVSDAESGRAQVADQAQSVRTERYRGVLAGDASRRQRAHACARARQIRAVSGFQV